MRGAAPSPSYPAPGINIDYFLGEKVDDIELEIVDITGKTIRSFNNQKQQAQVTVRDMATNVFSSTFSSALKKSKGLHRFRWDLKHNGAWDKNKDRSQRNGPYVAPGLYKVKLKVNGKTQEQKFRVLRDPKVSEDMVSEQDLKAQESFCLEIIDLMSEAKRQASKLEKLREKMEGDKTEIQKALDYLLRSKGRYTQPKFISQLGYLYGIVSRADQVPGDDAYRRFEQLKKEYESFMKLYKL